MFSRRRFLPLVALALFALLSACGNDAKKDVAHKSVADRFPVKVGDRMVQMQIAILPAETTQGLMFVQSMGEDDGMIFVFGQPQQMSFWMRNTELPLDIAYFDTAGKLREIYPMYPHDERPVISLSHEIQYCLEMNQGWYGRAGIKAGAQLDLTALTLGIQARGLNPGKFGLR